MHPPMDSPDQVSGYHFTVALIVLPLLIMQLVIFVMCLMPCTPQDNRYGPYRGDSSMAGAADSVVYLNSARPDRLD